LHKFDPLAEPVADPLIVNGKTYMKIVRFLAGQHKAKGKALIYNDIKAFLFVSIETNKLFIWYVPGPHRVYLW